MKPLTLCTAATLLTTLGGLATMATAQPPLPQPTLPQPQLQTPAPQVLQWPGGYLVMNGPEVIVRNTLPRAGATNLITGSGNGIGNRMIVSGGAGGVTVVQSARNGIGNSLILDPGDLLLDLDQVLPRMKPVGPKPDVPPAATNPGGAPPVATPAGPPAPTNPATPPSYAGKGNGFWSKKVFSESYDCNLYWCPTTKLWFRYIGDDDMYRPVPVQPPPPGD